MTISNHFPPMSCQKGQIFSKFEGPGYEQGLIMNTLLITNMRTPSTIADSTYMVPHCEIVLLENESDILEASAPGTLDDYNYENLF